MTQSQPSKQSVRQLLQTTAQQGIGQAASEILVQNLTPNTVAGAQGVSYEALGGDKAMLFVPVLDMTGSMEQFRRDVIEAYNMMLKVLKGSSQVDQMLLSAWTFNTASYLLHGYTPVEFAPELDKRSYRPNDQTALYDAVLDAITGVVAYGQELRNQGARTRITLVVFTDGGDNASRHTANHVRTVVADLLKQEIYTFALVGFGTGFAKTTAHSMGFSNVMEANANADDIKHALEVVSQSVIRASQTIVSSNTPNAFFS